MSEEWPRRRHLEYLLDEGVGVAEPSDRESLIGDDLHGWPEGWWGVWDEDSGFIAYFQFEADAYSFRIFLCAMRQNGEQVAKRYKK
jgi:hypothetical protein